MKAGNNGNDGDGNGAKRSSHQKLLKKGRFSSNKGSLDKSSAEQSYYLQQRRFMKSSGDEDRNRPTLLKSRGEKRED